MPQSRRPVGVIGAGLMGHAIALTFGRAGHPVRVFDPVPESLATLHDRVASSLVATGSAGDEVDAALARISTTTELAVAVDDTCYVTEAAPEKPELKREIFGELERYAPREAILASNTSVIPITDIAIGAEHSRDRIVGTHWWNPGHLIPLVEVIRTEWTSTETVDATMALLASVGKSPARVERDIPGFIGNRLQHALWREAISLVENGVCTAETVDLVVTSSFGRRLAVLGPLANADLVGTDLTLDIHEQVLHDLDATAGPSPYLRQLVAEGRLGMKTGSGFREWTDDEAAAVRTAVTDHLVHLTTALGPAPEQEQD